LKILIDTNILIELEDNKIINKSFSNFYRLAVENNCHILYHPEGVPQDLQRDKDSGRRDIISSKLKKYESLTDFAKPNEGFISRLRNKKINDEIDNKQVYQLYKGYVDLFVTEDKGIHKNAKKVKVESKTLKIKDALSLLESKFTFKIPTHPILREHSIREIETKFDHNFFDSLRNDYGVMAFDDWLQKCVRNNRKCYSLIVNNDIQAILIYNQENVQDHKLPDIYEDALKICTLKVDDSAFGIKLGELFLNKMFELCVNRKVNHLYLTVYPKQIHLIRLLELFGFYKVEFKNSSGKLEMIMIKSMNKTNINDDENIISNHPFYFDDSSIGKYVIPIKPEFYGTLFKDGRYRQPTLFDTSEASLSEIQGNTILKAYISNSKNKRPKIGDILFFYSSRTNQVIEPVGILESIQTVTNFDELLKLVNKKTVFSSDKLENMLNEKGQLHVIIFRLVTYLKNNINLTKIKEVESFKNKLQTITQLKEVDYTKLKNEKYFDERYIIN
jgi:predicted GNAT family N-acyltransferase